MSKLTLVISLCMILLTSCESIDGIDFIPNSNHSISNKCKLILQTQLKKYDEAIPTRESASSEWKDGEIVYLIFYSYSEKLGNGEQYGYGYGEYSAKDDLWNVTYSVWPNLPSEGYVKVVYIKDLYIKDIDNALSTSLSYENEVYEDSSASFLLDPEGNLLINAILTPKTSRIRFRGMPGLTFSVERLNYISEFTFTTGWFNNLHNDLYNLVINENGYTDNIHVCDVEEDGKKFYLSYTDDQNRYFSRTVPSHALIKGKSGYFDIPTIIKHDNWNYLSLSTKSISFQPVGGKKSITISSNCETLIGPLPNENYAQLLYKNEDILKIGALLPSGEHSLELVVNKNEQGSRKLAIQVSSECLSSSNLSIDVYQESNKGYVDLGLPSGIKWAPCNIGANSPEDYGDYFAWGETEPKEFYDWTNYKHGTFENITKYNLEDGKIVFDPEDDAAATNWEDGWRIPTQDEFNELLNNCSWTWISLNGINGCNFVGPNGNTIFFPAAGSVYLGSDIDGVGVSGHYITSSFTMPEYFLHFECDKSGMGIWDLTSRCMGCSIRPVHE